jgi:hypothetical protein
MVLSFASVYLHFVKKMPQGSVMQFTDDLMPERMNDMIKRKIFYRPGKAALKEDFNFGPDGEYCAELPRSWMVVDEPDITWWEPSLPSFPQQQSTVVTHVRSDQPLHKRQRVETVPSDGSVSSSDGSDDESETGSSGGSDSDSEVSRQRVETVPADGSVSSSDGSDDESETGSSGGSDHSEPSESSRDVEMWQSDDEV